jgi:hypothetical protein
MTSYGAKAANITLTSNDPGSPRIIRVSGTAPTPELDLIIANTGNFGNVCIGSFVDKLLTLLDGGPCNLTVTNVASSANEFVVRMSWPIRFGSQVQHLAGNTAGARVTAEEARHTLEPFYKNQPDNAFVVARLSLAYAVLGEKDSALKEAQRPIVLLPSAKDRALGPGLEENLALIQMTFGENSRAISTLRRLLQTPYSGGWYAMPVTPALLRLDPIWDPLCADPAFQKLCEEKQP